MLNVRVSSQSRTKFSHYVTLELILFTRRLFKTGCVKVLNGEAAELNRVKKAALQQITAMITRA
ncbi:hypothetical protein DVH05_016973 [Phytophthora capsici]|nr:hypothetical protein DVH05_016973 [Phytophthora capsici]